jgi:hypothetical protein
MKAEGEVVPSGTNSVPRFMWDGWLWSSERHAASLALNCTAQLSFLFKGISLRAAGDTNHGSSLLARTEHLVRSERKHIRMAALKDAEYRQSATPNTALG